MCPRYLDMMWDRDSPLSGQKYGDLVVISWAGALIESYSRNVLHAGRGMRLGRNGAGLNGGIGVKK